ncbi:hypothetical protein N7520_003650 [Penicillium odoratum]|uniref:uncharacterized protein n=1 Tax=Penicillium odoratum TaxID=1167516 RepID=UPI0025468256|nr:uncharacterized protein N7520_003650 [Penicillium odoratum]KAJ5769091.1 hypothetical protein N7520_003650 [Penicillium odoratum]
MGSLLIRGWVLVALAMQSFASAKTITETTTADPVAVVTVQPTTTPTPQATHHHHHQNHHIHWTYISRALPSRKACSVRSSSVPSSRATLASSAIVVSSSSAAISTSTPYSKPVPTHSVHHHHHHSHHWTHTSLSRPHRTACSSSKPIAISSSSAPTSTPLHQTTARTSVPGSVASGNPQPSGGVPAQSGNPLPETTVTPTGSAPAGSTAQSTTSTIVSTRTATIAACPSATPNCPPSSKTTFVTTETVVVSTTVCPVADATQTTSLLTGGQPSVKPEGPEFTISTIFSTRTATITACPSSVTNCPARSKTTFLTTETIAVTTTVCPVADATQTTSPSISGGEAATKSEELGFTTSTVFNTRTATITACPSSVTDCPARSKTTFVTTEAIAVSTTICPITEAAGATQTSSVSGSTGEGAGAQGNGNGGSESTISTIWTTRVATVLACPASVTNCPLRSKTTYLTTETVAIGTTAIAASAQATSPSEGATVTTQVVGVDSQATESVSALPKTTVEALSGSSRATGGQSSSGSGSGSGVAAVYTALYTVESCGSSDTCTQYVKTVVMTQPNVAQPTMTSSLAKTMYGSGIGGIPTASASSAHMGQQGSQSGGVSTGSASSTSSAAYAVYTGAASGTLQWSLLKMIGTAMVMLVAILA